MSAADLLDFSPEVAEARSAQRPIVALESTIITHGMPYPRNVETALSVEDAVREMGAVPAAIAVIDEADLGDEDAELTVGDAQDHDLAWYATQELPFLLELL